MFPTVKIYCPNRTARHEYAFNLLFYSVLSLDVEYIDDRANCHICYDIEYGNSGLHIIPHGLLSESHIDLELKPQIEKWGNTYSFFKTSRSLLIPFDIFSAAFFLCSRYEEYQPYTPDAHNRFPAEASILTKAGVLDEPLVNQWALVLLDYLAKDNKSFYEDKTKLFVHLSTLDIDQAWKYRNKGIVRNVLGALRDLKNGKWINILERGQVLFFMKADPFFNFAWQAEVHKKYDTQLFYFFLMGDYAKFDKNVSHKNKSFKKLIKMLWDCSYGNVGIHPSYASNSNPNSTSIEKQRLERVLETEVISSRQHFLMHTMPSTYRGLLDVGILEDHTLGYSTHYGFRAGICSEFNWFDLERNEATALSLVPFCAMDITPLHYRKETPEEAIVGLKTFMKKVKDVGGLFVTLWHNESLSESERWAGWRKVYLAILEESNRLQK